MSLDRRQMLFTTATAGLAASTMPAAAASRSERSQISPIVLPSNPGDNTARLQAAIDQAARLGQAVQVAPGRHRISGRITLRPGTKLVGPYGLAVLELTGSGTLVAAQAADIVVAGIEITAHSNNRTEPNSALIELTACSDLQLEDIIIRSAPANAIRLWRCSGRVHHCRIEQTGHTAINSGNASGLEISHNVIQHAGNNGIVVWRDQAAPDGTTIVHNQIRHIRTDSGGSGQNGNAINAFRAANVIIQGNIIADCAYSAVRCNAASNAQIIANNCRQIGEVALYAEFAFEGAVISNNIVDTAATGIEVTNFKEGGRLATVQGNVIRNLFRREHEPVDKRGIGISVEADTLINANTVENASTAGLSIGWGKWVRHVGATGNLIRQSDVGIAITSHAPTATILLTGNIITANRNGGVRLFDHNTPIGPALNNAVTNAPAVLLGNMIS
jgi:uncharacterized secreted repeat protein (TIGR03808 family)